MKPEARISNDIRKLLQQVGFCVWSTEQGYRKDRGGTRMSPGIPDLIIAGQGHTLFVEVKTPKGKTTLHQRIFAEEWSANGGTSLVWRSDGDAWDWCVSEGIIEETDDAA